MGILNYKAPSKVVISDPSHAVHAKSLLISQLKDFVQEDLSIGKQLLEELMRQIEQHGSVYAFQIEVIELAELLSQKYSPTTQEITKEIILSLIKLQNSVQYFDAFVSRTLQIIIQMTKRPYIYPWWEPGDMMMGLIEKNLLEEIHIPAILSFVEYSSQHPSGAAWKSAVQVLSLMDDRFEVVKNHFDNVFQIVTHLADRESTDSIAAARDITVRFPDDQKQKALEIAVRFKTYFPQATNIICQKFKLRVPRTE